MSSSPTTSRESHVQKKCSITALLSSTQGTSTQPLEASLDEICESLNRVLSDLRSTPSLRMDVINHRLDSVIQRLDDLRGSRGIDLEHHKGCLWRIKQVAQSCEEIVSEKMNLLGYVSRFNEDVEDDRDGMSIHVLTQHIMRQRGTQGGRKRRLEKEKVKILEGWYTQHTERPYLTDETLRRLTEETGLTKVQIRNWISNKRRKERAGSISDELIGMLTHREK